MSRSYFSKLTEHFLQFVVVRSCWELLDEDVVEFVDVVTFAFFTLLMNKHLDLLALEFEVSAGLYCLLSNFGAFELDVAETAGFSIWVLFQLAGFDATVLGERIVELLLRDIERNVTDENICFGVSDTSFLEV